MKVKDLIEELQKLDPEAIVISQTIMVDTMLSMK